MNMLIITSIVLCLALYLTCSFIMAIAGIISLDGGIYGNDWLAIKRGAVMSILWALFYYLTH